MSGKSDLSTFRENMPSVCPLPLGNTFLHHGRYTAPPKPYIELDLLSTIDGCSKTQKFRWIFGQPDSGSLQNFQKVTER